MVHWRGASFTTPYHCRQVAISFCARCVRFRYTITVDMPTFTHCAGDTGIHSQPHAQQDTSRTQEQFAHAAALWCGLSRPRPNELLRRSLLCHVPWFDSCYTLHSSAALACQRAFWLLTHTLQSLQSDLWLLTHTAGPPEEFWWYSPVCKISQNCRHI